MIWQVLRTARGPLALDTELANRRSASAGPRPSFSWLLPRQAVAMQTGYEKYQVSCLWRWQRAMCTSLLI